MDIALLGLACGLAAVYGVWFSLAGASWAKSFVKTVSVLALALIAWRTGGPDALVLGLLLGAMGDFWLSRDGETPFLIGLVSFAFGHIAYVVLLLQFGTVIEVSVWTGLMVVFAIAMAANLWPHTGALRLPVLGYIAIIATMGILAMGLPDTVRLGLLAALVFVVSDTILALEVFVIPKQAVVRRITSRAVWITYFAAQVLFLQSFAGQIPH